MRDTTPRLRRPSRRDILKYGGIGGLGAALAACSGGGSNDGGDGGGDGGESAHLVYSTWAADEELAVTEALIDSFQEANPGITVEIQTAAFADYATWVQTRLAGNTEPDVMFMSELWYRGFADLGALADLGPHVEGDPDFALDDFSEVVAGTGYFNDTLYFTSYGLDMSALFYNKTAFDEAGVDYPTEDWTWDDLREAAKALVVTDGGTTTRYGLFSQNGYGSGWNWVWGNGGLILNEDLTQGQFSTQATTEAIQYAADMMLEDGSIPPVDVQEDLGSSTMFMSGQVAMGMYGHYLIPRLETEKPFEWGTAMLANGPVSRNSFVSGAGFVMSARTEHPEAAWKLISHMNGKDGQGEFMRMGTITPSRISLANSEEFLSVEANDAFVKQTEHLVPLPITPKWNEYYGVIQTELDRVYRGQATMADVAPGLDEQINAILAG